MDRALAIIEHLARNGMGLPLSEIADSLSIPRSAAHRVLADLRDDGYVRQEQDGGNYGLTAKVVSLGFTYLSTAGVTDAIQPILDRLADETGEVVVMAVIDAGRLVRVAKARGARQGLVYNPDEGSEVYLATTSNGHAWLSCLTDEDALHLVAKQGFSRPSDGPRAPRSIGELLDLIAAARARGYAKIFETYVVGTSAMAAPIRRPGTREPIGTLSVAGPLGRFTDALMDRFAPALMASADAVAKVARSSPLFEQGRDGI